MSKLLGALNGLAVLHGGDDAAVRARVVAVAALRKKTRSSAVVAVGVGLRIGQRAGGQDPGRDEHLFLCAR